jgi:Zn-dependent peptidase ImmA (M78 family)
MPEPLLTEGPPTDFRTFEGETPALTIETLAAIDEARDAQIQIALIAEETPSLYSPPDIPTVTLNQSPLKAAARERQRQGLTDDIQLAWSSFDEAFRTIRATIEEQGVFTFQKDFPLEDCRGFSLYGEAEIPIIVINKNENTNQAKTFTLLHEYAHLLLRSTGVCDESSDNRFERFSNQFAAAYLMPSHLVAQLVARSSGRDGAINAEVIKAVSRRLKVSQQATVLRLEELRYVPKDFYSDWLANLEHTERPPERQRGMVPWQTRKISEFGRRFSILALEAVDRNVVSRRDALTLLNTTNGVFEKMRASLIA